MNLTINLSDPQMHININYMYASFSKLRQRYLFKMHEISPDEVIMTCWRVSAACNDTIHYGQYQWYIYQCKLVPQSKAMENILKKTKTKTETASVNQWSQSCPKYQYWPHKISSPINIFHF